MTVVDPILSKYTVDIPVNFYELCKVADPQ